MAKAKKRRHDPDDAGGSSTRGPPVATTSGRLGGGAGASDDWQTARRSWAAIAEVLGPAAREKRIWMPFYYDGACAEHLRELGFTRVHHKREDFFVQVRNPKFLRKVDLILDNPPYTSPEMKEAVLRALASTGKPFVMLLPISVLHVGFAREVLDTDKLQAVVPRRVYVRKTGGEEVPFKYLCWLCCGVQLKRDLILIGDDDDAAAAD